MRAFIFLCISLLLLCMLSLLSGPATTWSEVWNVIAGDSSAVEFWFNNSSLFELRLVHVILALCVGFALASGGRAMQLFLQNPLADPHIVGLSAGSTTLVLLCILLWPSFAATYFFDFIPAIWIAAFVGSALALIFVQLVFFGVVRRWGIASLALAGLLINAGCSALMMLIFARLSPAALSQVQAWTLGSIQPHSLSAVALLAPLMLFSGVVLIRFDAPLRMLSFGSEFAIANGVDVKRMRFVLLSSLMILCATTVCAAGSVGFVGLLIPHLSRRIFFHDHFAGIRPWLNALLGATLLVLADLCSRTLTTPIELPVGVYTALLSTPFLFLVLLRQRSVQ